MSATLPHEVLEMTHKFMTEPLRVLVKRDELTLEARPAALRIGLSGVSIFGNGARQTLITKPLRMFVKRDES